MVYDMPAPAEKSSLEIATLERKQVVRCGNCGSTSVSVVNQGFGFFKALFGGLIFGPVGLAAGAIGSGNARYVCRNCGCRGPVRRRLNSP